jgi:hypothetical protein
MAKASRTARTIVARWFIGGSERKFVPLSAPVIPVSRNEELAITAEAERAVAELHERMSLLLFWTATLAGATPWLGFVLGRRYGWFSGLPTGAGAIGALCIAGIAILWTVWHYERAQFDLRDTIALALRERRHLALAEPERETLDLRQLSTIVMVLLGAGLFGLVANGLLSLAEKLPAFRALAGVVAGIAGGGVLFGGFWLFRRRAAAEDGADCLGRGRRAGVRAAPLRKIAHQGSIGIEGELPVPILISRPGRDPSFGGVGGPAEHPDEQVDDIILHKHEHARDDQRDAAHARLIVVDAEQRQAGADEHGGPPQGEPRSDDVQRHAACSPNTFARHPAHDPPDGLRVGKQRRRSVAGRTRGHGRFDTDPVLQSRRLPPHALAVAHGFGECENGSDN